MFEKDAEDLIEWLREHGKCAVPTLILHGEHSSYGHFANKMMEEVMEKRSLQSEVVEDAAHFLPEENPRRFTELLLGFVGEHLVK